MITKDGVVIEPSCEKWSINKPSSIWLTHPLLFTFHYSNPDIKYPNQQKPSELITCI